MDLAAPVEEVKGIGPKTAEVLRKANILTLRDLVYHLPRDYENYAYITVRNVNDEWWFYGAFTSDFDRALRQAVEIGGQVMPCAGIQRA